jgi:hypothetical protein
MRVRFQADADLDGRIIRGLRRVEQPKRRLLPAVTGETACPTKRQSRNQTGVLTSTEEPAPPNRRGLRKLAH